MKTTFCLLGLLLTAGNVQADSYGGHKSHYKPTVPLVWTQQELREIHRSQQAPAPYAAEERRVHNWARAHRERATMYQRARAGSWERSIPFGGASLNVKSLRG